MKKSLNLDRKTPKEVAAVLYSAAHDYYESAMWLERQQDRDGARLWTKLAKIMDKAASEVLAADKASGR